MSPTMNLLARIELDALGDPDRPCAEAASDLEYMSTLKEDGLGGSFEKSMRIKATIDGLSVQALERPGWKVLAAIVNSELRLWLLNADTPLRHNPFLTHWVEAAQRLQSNGSDSEHVRNLAYAAPEPSPSPNSSPELSAKDVSATRLALIQTLLTSKDVGHLATATPRQIHHALQPITHFNVQPYIRMLEEEGIYEPSPASSTTTTTTHHDSPPETPNDTTRRPTFQEWKRDLTNRLSTDHTTAIEDLTHLPIALPALDFLTTLLTDHTLTSHNIPATRIVTSYIQHALRLIEHMGLPPTTTTDPPRQTDIGIDTGFGTLDHSQEAQSRAVRLLLLFIRNLLRRELVDLDMLHFDVQEICVRYLWIKEVRDFKAWIGGLHGVGMQNGEGG